MLRLYLIRHGLTEWNNTRRLQGHTDVPLSEEGIKQANLIAERLSKVELNAVWSSDLNRARITAEIIAEAHSIEVRSTQLLRETMLGEWEGLTQEDIIARGDEPKLKAYHLDPMANRPPGGEPLECVWSRIIEARDQIISSCPEGSVAVVGHGGSLRVFLCDALGLDVSGLRRIWLDNVSLSMLEYWESGSWVRLVNDTCHLHADGVSD